MAARKTSTATKADESKTEIVEPVEETVEAVESVDETAEVEEAPKKKTVEKENVKPLDNDDEIKVVSLIPNVVYRDRDTYELYEWEEVGHVELMTFATINNMWKRHKGYFRNLWLKPEDSRVIKKLGLERTFKNYEYLMDAENYDRKNIEEVLKAISACPNDMKFSIVKKINSMVSSGDLTDVSVIRRLENKLNIELVSLLD